jgi:tetratricopeptide (TPR) repeat protein
MSGATDELLALLDAAEACLRAAIVEALPPAAVLRIERNSTREARRLVAEAAVDRTVDLPLGWAEFVEIDAELDALLARLPPVQVVERVIARPRPAPAPVVIEHAVDEAPDRPLEIYVEEAAPPPPPVIEPSWTVDVKAGSAPAVVPEPTWVVGLDEAPPAPAVVEADDELPDWAVGAESAVGDDEATLVEHAGQVEALRDPTASEAPRTDEPAFVTYEEQPVYEDDDEEYYAPLEPADDVEYITYVEPTAGVAEVKLVTDDEPLPSWAAVAPSAEEEVAPPRAPRPTKKKEPEPRPLPAPPPEPDAGEDTWTFSRPPEAPVAEPTVDAYAVLRKERMRLDDFTQVERPAPVDEDEAAATRPARAARSGPAAIQLAADGSARVLGGDEDDEATNVIALGDTRDYGDEDAIDDDQTGILGVGVVEYDDEDELEEIEEIEGTLDDLPGAPELTPAEISALYARAIEAGKRNMADGALLLGDALDADPRRIDALLARGRFYLDLGDFPGAISDFLKAEGLAPRDPDVQVALGDLFQGRKDYGKAVSYYNRALAIDGDHALSLARRGMAHYYRKQFNAAVEDLERAKKLDPSLPHVDTYLSRARRK